MITLETIKVTSERKISYKNILKLNDKTGQTIFIKGDLEKKYDTCQKEALKILNSEKEFTTQVKNKISSLKLFNFISKIKNNTKAKKIIQDKLNKTFEHNLQDILIISLEELMEKDGLQFKSKKKIDYAIKILKNNTTKPFNLYSIETAINENGKEEIETITTTYSSQDINFTERGIKNHQEDWVKEMMTQEEDDLDIEDFLKTNSYSNSNFTGETDKNGIRRL
jgi:phosphopantetheine adenylyltransferase